MTELEGQSGHLTSTAYAAQQQLPHVRSAEEKSAVVAKAVAQGFVSKFNGVSWCKRDKGRWQCFSANRSLDIFGQSAQSVVLEAGPIQLHRPCATLNFVTVPPIVSSSS